MGTGDFTPTHRTTALRDKGRIRYDRAVAHEILDESFEGHMAFVVDGEPRVLPTLIVRVGDTLYLHGSTGSRPMLAARGEGLRVCVEATVLDALVLARSQFNHSANYRSVIVHGTAVPVTDVAEKQRVLTALVDKIAVGRAADSRPGTRKELSQTTVLALPLTEVSAKVRAHGVGEEEPGDETLPHWAGVLPLHRVRGLPEPDAGVTVPVPAYLEPGSGPWRTAERLAGEHVVLEPLDLAHAEGLLASCGDPAVWQHMLVTAPATVDEMRTYLRARLAAPHAMWVQKDARTGAIIGSTSYYDINETHRTVAIGHTFVAPSHWRTGVNTESKLLLLTRAFEHLGAVRVEWHTDLRNVRSQRAIERLGAVKEGVLRRHRRRADGTWRDTVLYAMTDEQWPDSRSSLRKRLQDHPAPGA